MSQQEQWRQIKGFEGLYDISDKGRIYSYYSNKFLRPDDKSNGYLKVTLVKNKKKFKKLIHQLVAEAFIENPRGFPELHHKNEIKTDNRVENLEYVSCQYNTEFSKAGYYFLYGPDDEKIQIYNLRKFARNNNLNYGSLRNVTNGIIKSYMGYTKQPNMNLNRKGKFSLTSPDGEEFTFNNNKEAANYIGDFIGNISKLLKGKQKSVKGWTRAD